MEFNASPAAAAGELHRSADPSSPLFAGAEIPCLSCAGVVASLHNGVDANWLPLPRRCDGMSAPALADGGAAEPVDAANRAGP